MAWTDTFTAGALADMGFSGDEIDAWSAQDDGTVSGGGYNSPGWANVLDSLFTAGAKLGSSALAPKPKTTTASAGTLLIIGGAVLLAIALIGGLLFMRK